MSQYILTSQLKDFKDVSLEMQIRLEVVKLSINAGVPGEAPAQVIERAQAIYDFITEKPAGGRDQ